MTTRATAPRHTVAPEDELPETFEQFLSRAREGTPVEFVKQREGWTDRQGSTHMVSYVEWHYVADFLDNIWPKWSYKIHSMLEFNGVIACVASITVDGVTREGVGCGDADKGEMGIKKAESDALKRAAVKFGIARDLYQSEESVVQGGGGYNRGGGGSGGGDGAPSFPRDPLARSMADLVTPKQLGMIRALAREAGVDADEECAGVLGCKTEELSKKAASSFIDHLKQGGFAQSERVGAFDPKGPAAQGHSGNGAAVATTSDSTQTRTTTTTGRGGPDYNFSESRPNPPAQQQGERRNPHVSEIRIPRFSQPNHALTDAQHKMIRSQANEKNLDPNQVAQEVFNDPNINIEELSKVAASALIDYIMQEAEGIPF